MTTKADVLRRVADAMDAGAPDPISITVYSMPIGVLVSDQDDWKRWVVHLGGRPADGVLVDPYPGEHRPSVQWTDVDVKVEYLEAMTVREIGEDQ